jgi:hypothetical protein
MFLDLGCSFYPINLSFFTTRILGFSNSANWLTCLFWLMDMSIYTKGPKHVFFDQSTRIKWFIWPLHPIKLETTLFKWPMSFNQMGHLMPITYLPFISHLQSYNLPTYQPTHSPKCNMYLLSHPPTYLNVLFTYLPTYTPTYLPTYLLTHRPTRCKWNMMN